MTAIEVGATIVGKSGKQLIVDSINGDILCCGGVKIHISAVVRVIPPRSTSLPTVGWVEGERVRFIGSYQEWGIEPDTILTVGYGDEDWVKVYTIERKPFNIQSNLLERFDDDEYPSVDEV
jgi:hypothetical protein